MVLLDPRGNDCAYVPLYLSRVPFLSFSSVSKPFRLPEFLETLFLALLVVSPPMMDRSSEQSTMANKDAARNSNSENSSAEYKVQHHETSRKSISVCVTAALGGFLYGFSGNAMSGTLAQPSFIAAFLSDADALQRTDGLFGGYVRTSYNADTAGDLTQATGSSRVLQ